jgi:hypothetical protein
MVGSRAGRRAVVVRWRAAGSHQRKIKIGAVGRLISLATECCQLLSSCVWSFHDPRPTVPQALKLSLIALSHSRRQPPCTILDPATKHPYRFSHQAPVSILSSGFGQGTPRPGPSWCALRCCAVQGVGGGGFGGRCPYGLGELCVSVGGSAMASALGPSEHDKAQSCETIQFMNWSGRGHVVV